MFDVITVGSANIDVFMHTEDFHEKKLKGMMAYPIGEKILVEEIRFTTGGGGTNSAVALARLGHNVGFLGVLGKDENGKTIKEEMKKEGVSNLCQETPKHTTGYSVVLDSIEHDRTIFVYKGANDHLEFDKIDKSKLKTKWFYFSTLLGKSFGAQEKLAEFAGKKEIKILFNASSYLVSKGPKILKKILDNTTILVLNMEEAEVLVGKDNVGGLMRKLRKLGPDIAVITDGKKGVHVSDGKNIYFAKPHNVKVVETTGAGDAFASGFLSGYIQTRDIGHSIQTGMTDAESVIQHHGAKNRLVTRKEMASLLKKNPVQVSREKVQFP